MVVTYYIKLFRMWTDIRSGILMSLRLLVAGAINLKSLLKTNKCHSRKMTVAKTR